MNTGGRFDAAALVDPTLPPAERRALSPGVAAAAHLRAALSRDGARRRFERRADRHDLVAWAGNAGSLRRRLSRRLRGPDGAQGRASRRALEHSPARLA